MTDIRIRVEAQLFFLHAAHFDRVARFPYGNGASR